jgi:hypothetical protein
MKYTVLLVNLFNTLDLITTYICLNTRNCYEWNKFVIHYPAQFFTTRIIAIPILSVILYKLAYSSVKLISDTAKLLLFMLMFIYLFAVVNDVSELMIAYRW